MVGESLIARPRRSGHQIAAPIAKAYLLAYASIAGPRLVAVGIALFRRRATASASLAKAWRALKQTAAWNHFPAFCAVLIGGSINFQVPLRVVAQTLSKWLRRHHVNVNLAFVELLVKFTAALIAASISFEILNSKPSQPLDYRLPTGTASAPTTTAVSNQSENYTTPTTEDALSRAAVAKVGSPVPPLSPKAMGASSVCISSEPLAGRTMDLTLFAATRSLDIIIAPLLLKSKSRTGRHIAKSSTPLLFALSSAVIMHAWFYTPYRLPQAYNDWISSAAQVDPRLVTALRHARYGKFVYGRETGIEPLLGSMCRDYGWPEEWGNPAKTIPVPCEMVHMGCGPSCERHAWSRFVRAWSFAARMYMPLQLLVLIRRVRKGGGSTRSLADGFVRALLDGSRSSAFLGAFVSLFYYGMWDGGLCVLAGCLLCGWSVLFEKVQRRTEILFFVLPRAAAVWFPRRYLKTVSAFKAIAIAFAEPFPRNSLLYSADIFMAQNQWREHVAFALSAAVILTAAQERPERVRGVFGKLLGSVVNTKA
ncbi:uncharacterized protein BKCO1_1600060 [Diplodia corticola]|uniref:Integral membrane protein n=1 Tax=Diplodia corticola TaxID=236234 RepID=A0A1J9R5L7_9PEZI|nr:uncharacterized protein BKCO1_1600060 [Diplodia corticola]OJD35514.1 integral membrane protein [Diplodia corticola]